jgi:hypothetical protein
MPESLAFKVSNAGALLIMLVLLSGPIWYFIPRSLTPLASPLGKFRFGIGMILCHAGLIFWPIGLVLLLNLFRQRRWIEGIKLAALMVFCWWQAWDSTRGVIRTWTQLGQWLGHL